MRNTPERLFFPSSLLYALVQISSRKKWEQDKSRDGKPVKYYQKKKKNLDLRSDKNERKDEYSDFAPFSHAFRYHIG